MFQFFVNLLVKFLSMKVIKNYNNHNPSSM